MCGIMGYVGPKQAAPLLLEGLEKLEYRGYDSAGIAVLQKGEISFAKCRGRLKRLVEQTKEGTDASVRGFIGIGHTRWATHGEPSDINAHPHLSNSGRFAVVHNGIIENEQDLRHRLQSHGFFFRSETDTEVIAQLIEYLYKGDMMETIIEVCNRLEGSYALEVLCTDYPGKIFAVRKDCPLIIGLGENENFVASDIPAILSRTREIYLIEDKEICVVEKNQVHFFNLDRDPVTKDIFHVEWDVSAAEKGGFEHFMMKEIMEQPRALEDTIRPRLKDGKIVLDAIEFSENWLKNLRSINIVACGSACHAGYIGKTLFENHCRIPVTIDIASEFRYRQLVLDERDLVIIISQSGETADTIAAMREAQRLGARTLGIVNVVGSTIAREANDVLYTWAGPEIAVATTKAYTCQVAALMLVAMQLGHLLGNIGTSEIEAHTASLLGIKDHVATLLEQKEQVQLAAAKYVNHKDIYFIGRALDYAVSLEGSLKLKELSYIHSEASAAGELKHGPISLIETGTLVIAVATQSYLAEKTISNIREVRARGAEIFAIGRISQTERFSTLSECFVGLPDLPDWLMPLVAVIPLQLFSYYMAVLRGCDVDKPRNLAKSVTVE